MARSALPCTSRSYISVERRTELQPVRAGGRIALLIGGQDPDHGAADVIPQSVSRRDRADQRIERLLAAALVQQLEGGVIARLALESDARRQALRGEVAFEAFDQRQRVVAFALVEQDLRELDLGV